METFDDHRGLWAWAWVGDKDMFAEIKENKTWPETALNVIKHRSVPRSGLHFRLALISGT